MYLFSRLYLLALGLSLALTPAGATAQPIEALGEDFQVNDGTNGRQDGGAVGVAANGDFIVAWRTEDPAGDDTDEDSVVARRFSADGTPIGETFQVNSFTPHSQYAPSVRMEPTGEFVVAWRYFYDAMMQPNSNLLVVQRYDAGGAPLGGSFSIAGAQSYGGVSGGAIDGDGPNGFVGVMGDLSVFGRRVAPDGTTSDTQTFSEINPGLLNFPEVSSNSAGNFVVVWESDVSPSGDDTSGRSIQARAFDVDGSPISGQFQVNQLTLGEQERPDVELLDNGRILVTWIDRGADEGSGSQIQGRLLDFGGGIGSDEFQINSSTAPDQPRARVGSVHDEAFVVVWNSPASVGDDTDLDSIHGRLIHPTRGLLGNEFQVNAYTTGGQNFPQVDGNGDGFIVTWRSEASPGNDTSLSSVQARRFRFGGIFADGFESGDLSAWAPGELHRGLESHQR